MSFEVLNRAFQVTPSNYWDAHPYILNQPVGSTIQVTVGGIPGGIFAIYDMFGEQLLFVDDYGQANKSGSAVTKLPGPHFLVVYQAQDPPQEYNLKTTLPLKRYADPDDGTRVRVGESVAAAIDYPTDTDYFTIDLSEGEIVDIVADSVLIDTSLIVDFQGADNKQFVEDCDSGGGIYGENAKIIYKAPHTGTFFIVVGSEYSDPFGGYMLSVKRHVHGNSKDPLSPVGVLCVPRVP